MLYAIIQRAVQERHIYIEASSPSEAMRLIRDDANNAELDVSDFTTIKVTYRRDPSEDEETK